MFFRLHHYCNIKKPEVWEYTLPQVMLLMKETNAHIQFEVQTHFQPLQVLGSAFVGGGSTTSGDDEYHEATEEDINLLTRFLGG